MKINEVEQRVGITKKNIRFYEEKELICPARQAENGYRDYSERDVGELLKIKLLRRLSVPIEEIHMLQTGQVTFLQCMERQQSRLRQEQRNLEVVQELCGQLQEEAESLENLQAEAYLTQLEQMEKGGIVFVDVEKVDQRRQKRAPLLAAGVTVMFMLLTMGLLLWAEFTDPLPIGIFAVILAVPGVVIVGVLIALYLRMKEIEGGEANEAAKY